MHITLSKRNISSTILGFLAIPFALAFLVAYVVIHQDISKAAPVPESCFGFDSGTGTVTEYNPASDAACVSDVDIPATIGGAPVTIIDAGAFTDDTITSVNFPSSITLIESGAFNQAGVNLTSITLAASGNLVIADGAFGTFSGSSISITAGGDLTFRSDNFDGANLTNFSLSAGDELIMEHSSFGTSITATNATFHADGNLTVSSGGGFERATVTNLEVTADGDILLSGGAFQDSDIETMSITGGGAVLLSATLYQSSDPIAITNLSISATTTLDIESGSLSQVTDLEELSLTASGLITIADGSLSYDNSLATLNISASAGLSILDGSVSNLPALTDINFLALSGDVYIYGFNAVGLTDFTLQTDGSIETQFGSFGGANNLTTLSLDAGTDLNVENGSFANMTALADVTLRGGTSLTTSGGVFYPAPVLETVDIQSDGDILLTNGSFGVAPLLTTASIDAGGTLLITNGSFNSTGLTSLTLDSDDVMAIGSGSLQYGQLETITFPATLNAIGSTALYGMPLKAVYLNSAPTIGTDAFGMAGTSYDPNTSTYGDLDQIAFVPLFVSVPNSYTDTIYTPADYDGDSVDDLTGGYLVNPSPIVINSVDTHGTGVGASLAYVGELGDGTPITDYRISSNPTQDLSFYYRPGDQYTAVPAAIAPYITPATQTITLSAGVNTINFIYLLPGTPNTGNEGRQAVLLVAFIAAGAALAIMGGLVFKRLIRLS